MRDDQLLHQHLDAQHRERTASGESPQVYIRDHLVRWRIALVDEERLDPGRSQQVSDQRVIVAPAASIEHRVLARRAIKERRHLADQAAVQQRRSYVLTLHTRIMRLGESFAPRGDPHWLPTQDAVAMVVHKGDVCQVDCRQVGPPV